MILGFGRKKPAPAAPAPAPQHLLAIVFRNKDTILFDHFKGTDKPAPVIIPYNSAARSAEDDLNTIHTYLFDKFHIAPDDVSTTLQYHATSLEPISPTTFSLVYVELTDEDFARLRPQFIAYDAGRIMIERERNLFFDLIARDYYAAP